MIIVATIAIIIVIVIVITSHSSIQKDRDLKQKLKKNFGKPPLTDEVDYKSIEAYTIRTNKDARQVDKITWNDLDMNRVYERINVCLSSVGDEYLYDALKRPENCAAKLQKREELTDFFDKNTDIRLEVQYALAKISKKENNGVADLFFRSDFNSLQHKKTYAFFALLPVLAAIVLFFHVSIGFTALFFSFLVNMFIHFRCQKYINRDLSAINYFSRIIRCCEKFAKMKHFNELPCITRLTKLSQVFKKAASNSPSHMYGVVSGIEDVIWLYLSILFLIDVRGYNSFMELLKEKQDYAHEIYVTIGEIETAISVLSTRKSFPSFCIPEFCEENIVKFQDVYHPLINDAVVNSHVFNNDMILTGSNASGKSTFIKTLAINQILAQTINTCTAASFTTRFSVITTSMAVKDNIYEGESYFTAELKSIKRILDITKTHYTVCYIDEILRGTNTTERLIASQVLLSHLHKRECLCIVATHDIELTQILENEYDNYHFSEQVTDKDISFDYKLKPGPSKTKNAIKLLEVMEFDKEIIDDALAMVRD